MIVFSASCYVLMTSQLNMFHSGTKSYILILSALLLEENKMMEEIDDSDTLLRSGKYPFCSYCTGLTARHMDKGEHYPHREGHYKSHGHMARHDIHRVGNVILPRDEQKYLRRNNMILHNCEDVRIATKSFLISTYQNNILDVVVGSH